jgi:hypothetical protein
MRIRNPASDGKPQPVSSARFSFTQIRLVEAFKHPATHILCHANASVPHGYGWPSAGHHHLCSDLTVLWRVPDCIVEQNPKQALQKNLVTVDKDRLILQMPIQQNSTRFGEILNAPATCHDKIAQVQPAELNFVHEVVTL